MIHKEDKSWIENNLAIKKAIKDNPNRDWKTNITQRDINDLADEMGEPEFKKDDPYSPMQRYLIDSGQIKVDDDPLDNVPFPS